MRADIYMYKLKEKMAILLVNKCYIFRRKKTEISVPNHCLPMNPLPPIFIHSRRVRILASLFPSVLTSTGMDKSFTECFSSCDLVHISKVYGCVIEKRVFLCYISFFINISFISERILMKCSQMM